MCAMMPSGPFGACELKFEFGNQVTNGLTTGLTIYQPPTVQKPAPMVNSIVMDLAALQTTSAPYGGNEIGANAPLNEHGRYSRGPSWTGWRSSSFSAPWPSACVAPYSTGLVP